MPILSADALLDGCQSHREVQEGSMKRINGTYNITEPDK